MEKWLALAILLVTMTLMEGSGVKAEVTYDGRSLIIDGQRKILFSGSVHYPRSTPQVIKLYIYNKQYSMLLTFIHSCPISL